MSARDDEDVTERGIKAIHIHPQYDDTTAYYDIAIIEMEAPIEFKYAIRRVCLPPETSEFNLRRLDGRAAVLTGWGRRSQSGDISSSLRGAALTIYDQE